MARQHTDDRGEYEHSDQVADDREHVPEKTRIKMKIRRQNAAFVYITYISKGCTLLQVVNGKK